MIKLLFAWRDNPQRTAEECEKHYRDVHMKLAHEAYTGVDGFVAISYNRVVRHTIHAFDESAAVESESDIDAFVELWFEDRERLERAFASPVLPRMFEDHGNFMDLSGPTSIRTYDVSEVVYLGRRKD
jgi:uncharacterized protein (TIGR02118 family)